MPSRVSMPSGMFPYPTVGNRGYRAGVSGNETVGFYAHQAGVATGYFGKYMNMGGGGPADECCDACHTSCGISWEPDCDWTKMCDFCALQPGSSPPGWSRWFATPS